MKIVGKTIPLPQPEYVVIPRAEENIVITCAPVLDFDKFEQLCPTPQPRFLTDKDGNQSLDDKNPDYIKARAEHGMLRTAYILIESISATEGLEWETVNPSVPGTWLKWQDELREVGLTDNEIARILQAVTRASGLSNDRIEEATKLFYQAREGKASNGNFRNLVHTTTPSGEPAND